MAISFIFPSFVVAKIIFFSLKINPICAKRMYDTYQTPSAIVSAIDDGEKYFIVKDNKVLEEVNNFNDLSMLFKTLFSKCKSVCNALS